MVFVRRPNDEWFDGRLSCRITSYNVCYTKLLRSEARDEKRDKAEVARDMFSAGRLIRQSLDRIPEISEKMCTALKIAGACRMNVVISGGTGSGKTTMLNALSKMIDPGERVLT